MTDTQTNKEMMHSLTMQLNGMIPMVTGTVTMQTEPMQTYSQTTLANGLTLMEMESEITQTNSSMMEAKLLTQMETDTETMLTDQMQTHSLTILTNGRILMGMGMEMGTQWVDGDSDGRTIQTEQMVTSSQMIH